VPGGATPAWAGVFVLAAALLSGCAAPRVSELIDARPAGLPTRAEVRGVPFHPQEAYQCGPASLATVLQFAGKPVTPDALVPQVYVPARQGSLQAEMLAATRRQDLAAYPVAPNLGALLRQVAAGTPAVVLQNLALEWVPQWHYAVVIGYDLEARTIALRSGTTRRLVLSLDTFERTWARSGHWAMLALEPDRLPAAADERTTVAALAALERSSPAAARRGYAAALARWPDNEAAGLGLGNASYALGDLQAAAAAYARVTERHPDAADAWNNLAQALFELGRDEAARTAARRAVALGGTRADTYRETLRAIEQAR
jgi:tetratricopeptide (TPR) repeat protein